MSLFGPKNNKVPSQPATSYKTTVCGTPYIRAAADPSTSIYQHNKQVELLKYEIDRLSDIIKAPHFDPSCNVESIREMLVTPLLIALGWHPYNQDDVRLPSRDESSEADYTILVNGLPKIVIKIVHGNPIFSSVYNDLAKFFLNPVLPLAS